MVRNLKSAKVGDIIVVPARMGIGHEMYRVESVGKARINCGRASFMIESGVMVGTSSTWNTRYGRIPTDDDLARIRLVNRMQSAKETIRRIDVNESNLEAAEAFIKASKPKEAA